MVEFQLCGNSGCPRARLNFCARLAVSGVSELGTCTLLSVSEYIHQPESGCHVVKVPPWFLWSLGSESLCFNIGRHQFKNPCQLYSYWPWWTGNLGIYSFVALWLWFQSWAGMRNMIPLRSDFMDTTSGCWEACFKLQLGLAGCLPRVGHGVFVWWMWMSVFIGVVFISTALGAEGNV